MSPIMKQQDEKLSIWCLFQSQDKGQHLQTAEEGGRLITGQCLHCSHFPPVPSVGLKTRLLVVSVSCILAAKPCPQSDAHPGVSQQQRMLLQIFDKQYVPVHSRQVLSLL